MCFSALSQYLDGDIASFVRSVLEKGPKTSQGARCFTGASAYMNMAGGPFSNTFKSHWQHFGPLKVKGQFQTQVR